ncbi:hypothetical protein HY357_00665 [Candidatus Roizmanbacteria bacterium]|nr:hypothetical protein [Candidatus Roizmanbacteria bacterium]
MRRAVSEELRQKVETLSIQNLYSPVIGLLGLRRKLLVHGFAKAIRDEANLAVKRYMEKGAVPQEGQMQILKGGELDAGTNTISLSLRHGLRTPALQTFGKIYQKSSAEESVKGFVDFVQYDTWLDFFYADILAAVDKKLYMDWIDDVRGGARDVEQFLKELKIGTVSKKSFETIMGYWLYGQNDLEEMKDTRLIHQQRYLEAIRISSIPMKRALDYIEQNFHT